MDWVRDPDVIGQLVRHVTQVIERPLGESKRALLFPLGNKAFGTREWKASLKCVSRDLSFEEYCSAMSDSVPEAADLNQSLTRARAKVDIELALLGNRLQLRNRVQPLNGRPDLRLRAPPVLPDMVQKGFESQRRHQVCSEQLKKGAIFRLLSPLESVPSS